MKRLCCLNNYNKYQNLCFSRLRAQNLPLLLNWLNQPHVRAFYQPEAIDSIAISKKYRPRLIQQSPIHCYIISFERIPIGYIQTYLISSDLDISRTLQVKDGASIDLYVGNSAFLRQGLGPLIELKFLQEIVFKKFLTHRCYVYHEVENVAALKASEKAGFQYVRDLEEDGKLNRVLLIMKEDVERRVNGLLNQK